MNEILPDYQDEVKHITGEVTGTVIGEKITGYLYSFRKGTVTIHEGQVETYEDVSLLKNKHTILKGIFRTTTGRRLSCSPNPGVVESYKVWLPEKDDAVALATLLAEERLRIYDLENKIKAHKKRKEVLLNLYMS